MIVTENTPERVVVVEPVPATGMAFTWITPLRLTLRMLMLCTPGLRELASGFARAKSTSELGHCMEYPNLIKMPLCLGFISYLVERFESERETIVDFREQEVYQTERGFFAQQQNTIPFKHIQSLVMEKTINWNETSPTNYYRLYLRVRGKNFLFFEHMDKGRVEELLRGMATRMQLE